MVTLGDLLEAYYVCRRNKRTTRESLLYEMDYERSLVDLCRRVNDRTYEPSASVCFVVTRPRRREVFAADFEDRVLHHWMALRLEPLFERHFTARSFNCRKGKGQLYGVNRLKDDIWECSEGHTRDCWVMRMDISGLFMSIDRATLAGMLDRFITERYEGYDKEDLRWMCGKVTLHAPERNCVRHSPASQWRGIPSHKSLFLNGEGMGMPIGNLPSQHFANFLLDGLDKFVIGTLGFAHYGRYVDDFYVAHGDKAEMLSAVPRIREFLRGVGLALHPKKFYMQHYSKGVPFIGCVVKFGRVYPLNRTVYGFARAVERLNAADDIDGVESAVASVNSYLGLLRHYNSYAIRRRVLEGLGDGAFRWVYIKGHHDVVKVRKKYSRRAETLRMLRNGEWEQGRVPRDAGAGHKAGGGSRPALAGDRRGEGGEGGC